MTSGHVLRRNAPLGLIGALVAFGVSGGLTQPGPWRARVGLLIVCLVYGQCYALSAPFVVPAFLKRFSQRGRLAWWGSRLLALPFLCFIGGGLALLVLVPLGLLRVDAALNFMFPYARWGAPLGTVAAIFAVGTTYELLRDRLDAATIALRTKERDEAEARRVASEARLASLESRVHPHFLFNTLNSIAALIPDDPKGAERMTGRLATLMRSALDTAASPLVSLEQELDLVRAYLEIERVRFGDRLRYTIEAPVELDPIPVPRLSLQTLVENSVKYAVTPRRAGATLAVRARAAHERLHLEVEDDGPGFDESALKANHGLALLRARLAMVFGEDATLAIASAAGGTRVTITLPRDHRRDVPHDLRRDASPS